MYESILNILFANNQRPPNNLVSMPLSHCHDCLLCDTLTQTINSIIITGIAPKQNAFKFKIAPNKQKSIVKKMAGRWVPLANGALCLSTHKHNGKYVTAVRESRGMGAPAARQFILSARYQAQNHTKIIPNNVGSYS